MLSQFLSRKLFFTVSLSLSVCTLAKAQSTEPYYFAPEKYTKIPNSLYNKISLVDLRPDTLIMGFIQTGAFNKRATVVAQEPMENQVKYNFASLIDDSAKPNELILQLREIDFSEVTGGFSESGFFRMRASLFTKTDKGYQQINSIDTVAKVSAVDVSNGLLKKGGEVFAAFIASKLSTPVTQGKIVTYTEIAKADSIEKSQIKVFSTDAFVDGFYATYNSFKDQIPEGEIVVEGEAIKSNNVRAYDAERKLKTLRPVNVYAIVYKGIAYVGTTAGYSPVSKVANDLVFVSQTGGSPNTVYVAGGGAIGGAVGGLATVLTTPKKRNYNTKINHLNGNFIILAEISKDNK